MKKLRFSLLSLAVAAALLLPALPARAEGLELTAPSAVLMEASTGRVLFEKDPHALRSCASITKVMTLCLVFEALDNGRLSLDQTLTASAHAASMGGSDIWLEEGEAMSVDDLIKATVIMSANDAAVVLAEAVSGSEEAFVARMNERAAQLGMADTNFVNCTGLPAAGHLTSAYDIALMSRELILNHPNIRQYSTIWMDTIRGGSFQLANTNKLVRYYEGCTGLKTGSTDSALYCLSATAEREGMELIAVVMKSPTSADRFEDAKALLDYGFASYSLVSVYPDSPLAPIPVLLGEQGQVQPQLARECRLLVRKGQEGQISTKVTLAQDLAAPVEQGQTVGEMEVSLDGQVRDTVPILSAQGVERLTIPKIFSRLLEEMLMAG